MLQNLAPGEVSVRWYSSKGSEETFETEPGAFGKVSGRGCSGLSQQ